MLVDAPGHEHLGVSVITLMSMRGCTASTVNLVLQFYVYHNSHGKAVMI